MPWPRRGLNRRRRRPPRWRGLDVGSPFAHARAGILYVAAHLPPPGRDGTGSVEQLNEIAGLVDAAGGRTLGLFSSMRAARAAAEAMRDRLSTPVLCQGDDSTAALVERFAADPATSLFGTLSLWQGVDVPGPSLSLVIIDRIPFPRPDDPLLSARQRAVAARGRNGFMTVAASHAALLLAQGAAGCCAVSTTAAWSRCSTRGWPPPATAATCAPRCRRSGRRRMRRRCARRLSGCAVRREAARAGRKRPLSGRPRAPAA
ncbi:helicase C-terminal domain protein [Mycobacterium xenopi 3993]|nr:helicase C-terminal domain protein [Mycobacterium xenopi 3993]